jgi:hypothetical protein
MFVTRAPLVVHSTIRTLCDQIRSDTDPQYIRINPGSEDQPLDCFNNVRRRIAQDGGDIVFGWAIWEWPGIFVEAEHHAVWAPPSGGAWQDITPGPPSFRRRLFLPDDTAIYDFANEGILRDNVRLAVSTSPLVQAMFEAATERVAILNGIPGVGRVSASVETGRQLQNATMRQMQLQIDIGMTHTAPRAPCFCGSGKMFKQCHGR